MISFEQLEAYNMLSFCPVCGKELEINPNSGYKACFSHGDFEVNGYSIGKPVVVWKSLTR